MKVYKKPRKSIVEVVDDAGKSVLRYRGHDRKLRYVASSDSPESGGGLYPVKGKISFRQSGGIYANVDNSNLSNFTGNKAVLAKIARIEITNENLHIFVFGKWNIAYTGNGWQLYNFSKGINHPIQGTTASTKSNDQLVINEINKIVELQEVYNVSNHSITTTGVVCDFYKQSFEQEFAVGDIYVSGNLTEVNFPTLHIE